MKIKSNYLFYFSYFLILIPEMLYTISIFNKVFEVFNIIGVLGIFLYVFYMLIKNKIYHKYIVIFILLLIFSVYSHTIVGDFTFIKFLLLLFALVFVDFDKFIKLDFKYKLILTILLIVLNLLNFTDYRLFYRADGTVRYTFGFSHPNTFGFYTMLLTMELFYINKTNISLRHYFFIIVTILVNYYLSDSRTSVIILVLFLLYNILNNFIREGKKITKFLSFILKHSFIFFTLISLFLGFLYDKNNAILSTIDDKLSMRPQVYNAYLLNFDFKIQGNDLPSNINGKYLDNSYITLLLKFGIVQYCIYMVLSSRALTRLVDKKAYFLVIICFLLYMYGLMENATIKPGMNAFIFSLVFALKTQKGEVNE